MKKTMKKLLSGVLAFVMLFMMQLVLPQNTTDVEAAVKYSFDKAYQNKTVYYIPDGNEVQYFELKIRNQPKATQIKNVTVKADKSSAGAFRAYARKGCIRVYYRAAGTVQVSCKIGRQKLTTKLYVKKYTNPFASFKIGKTDFTKRYANTNEFEYYHTKAVKNQKLTIRMKKGFLVKSVYAYGTGSRSVYDIDKASYSQNKVSLSAAYSHIIVTVYDKAQKLTYNFDLYSYKE